MKNIKRLVLVLLACAMCMGIIGGLVGCNQFDPWKVKKEDQGFYYYVHSENNENVATILGLVDSDVERDELVIPENLGGYRVVQIGYNDGPHMFWGKNIRYIFRTNNIFVLVLNQKVVLEAIIIPKKILIMNYENYFWANSTWFWAEFRWILNFDAVGGDLVTYTMFIVEGNKSIEPQEPTKDGYKFDGWYLDIEYNKKWDFEQVAEKEMKFTLYAKWI